MKIGGGGGGGVGGEGSGWGVRVDVIEELKFLGKFTKTNLGGSGGVRWGSQVGRGGQFGCERRIEVFVKIPKKMGVGGSGGGWVGGVRVDVNEELKFL